MGVGFGRSSVADLTFQVFNRSLHPEWFATQEFRRVELKRWVADIRIVEGGHTVVFSSGPVRLTEVLSGPETVLPEPGRLFHSHLRRERSTILRPEADRRIPKLPRSRASRHRDLPPSLRRDRTERVRRRSSFTAISRLQSTGTAAHQPYPAERQSQRPVDSVLPLLSQRVAIVRTQSLFLS